MERVISCTSWINSKLYHVVKPRKAFTLEEYNSSIFLLLFTVSPRFTRVPGRFLVIKETAVASVTCEAFSHPPSVVRWTRLLAALPKGRSSVSNGTLTIQGFSIADMGTYVCNASNKLGSITAITSLGFQREKIKGYLNLSFYLAIYYTYWDTLTEKPFVIFSNVGSLQQSEERAFFFLNKEKIARPIGTAKVFFFNCQKIAHPIRSRSSFPPLGVYRAFTSHSLNEKSLQWTYCD